MVELKMGEVELRDPARFFNYIRTRENPDLPLKEYRTNFICKDFEPLAVTVLKE
jgi:hypothetical protein